VTHHKMLLVCFTKSEWWMQESCWR